MQLLIAGWGRRASPGTPGSLASDRGRASAPQSLQGRRWPRGKRGQERFGYRRSVSPRRRAVERHCSAGASFRSRSAPHGAYRRSCHRAVHRAGMRVEALRIAVSQAYRVGRTGTTVGDGGRHARIWQELARNRCERRRRRRGGNRRRRARGEAAMCWAQRSAFERGDGAFIVTDLRGEIRIFECEDEIGGIGEHLLEQSFAAGLDLGGQRPCCSPPARTANAPH